MKGSGRISKSSFSNNIHHLSNGFFILSIKKTVVRWYIGEINKLLAIAKTKPEGAAYEEIYSRIGDLCYRKKKGSISQARIWLEPSKKR